MNKQNHSLSYALLWCLCKAIALLPLGVNRSLGTSLGHLLLVLNTRAVKVARRNIELCFPQMDEVARRKFIRQTIVEGARLMMETTAIWARPPNWTKNQIVAIEGESFLKEELARGVGVMLLAPHIGNWEAVGVMLPHYSPVTCLYQPPDVAALGPIIQQGREKSGIKLAATDHRGVATLLKALKAGEMVGILPDQVPDQGAGAMADFFSVPSMTMTLANNLIKRTACRVVMGCAQRVAGGYKLSFTKPDMDIYHEDPAKALSALNKSVENCVRTNAVQYQWHYKRFKRRPPEFENLYMNLK